MNAPGMTLPAVRPAHLQELADHLVEVRGLLDADTAEDTATARVHLGRIEQALRIHSAAAGERW